MLAKQSWRLMVECNPLVSQFMKARYYPKSDFLNASLGSNPSYLWRSILATQDTMKRGMRRKIGNGLTTTVWKVPWLPDLQNGYLTTELYEQLQDIKVQSLLAENQKSWDVEVVSDLFTDRDKKLILQIPIPIRDKEDSWYWALEDKGVFSVKSCYRKIRGEYDCVDRVFWKRVWGLQLPGKMLNFLWRASVNVLPTAVALQTKRVNVNAECSWCHVAVENAVHTLFECSIAREVWNSVGLQDVFRVMNNDTVMTVLKRAINIGTRDQFIMVAVLCWSLWSRRNKWVWEKVNTSAFGIKAMALNLVADWRRARQNDETTRGTSTGHRKTWIKPPHDWIKINVDAAYRVGGDSIGVGCVVRDSTGKFLRARNNLMYGTSQVREAEAWSLKETIEWVKSWRTTKCIFESDAKLLVDAFQVDRGRSNFDTIVEACSDNLKHFEEVLIVFASQSANSIAHELARAAHSMSGPMEWFNTAPDFISCNIDLESL